MDGHTNGWRTLVGLAALAAAGGCGTVPVSLPSRGGPSPDRAVAVIERSARLNALTAAPEFETDGKPAWADAEGWYALENDRVVKLYYSDIASVVRCYANRGDVTASVCLAGLMGPFSGAYVDVTMKDGKVWRLLTDPGGDPAVFLNCAPMWLVTFQRPMRKTRLVAEAFESMRVRAGTP